MESPGFNIKPLLNVPELDIALLAILNPPIVPSVACIEPDTSTPPPILKREFSFSYLINF